MVFTVLPATVFAAESDTAVGASSVGKITAFDELGGIFEKSVPFDGHTHALSVKQGTSLEDLQLPDELTATVERTSIVTTTAEDDVKDSGEIKDEIASPSDADKSGTEEIGENKTSLASGEITSTVTTEETETISVTWKSNKEFSSDKDSNFIFTAELPEGYTLSSGVKLPQIYVAVGIQGSADDSNAITLSKSEIIVIPGSGTAVMVTPPGDAQWNFWCSVTGDKDTFREVSDFLDKTESDPVTGVGTQILFIQGVDGLPVGTYEMIVTIYGENSDASAAYAPATLTVTMTVSEPQAKWGTDGTYAVGSGTLTSAVTYANNLGSGTAYIQLQSNVNTTRTLSFNKTTVLDLNGKTIDAQGNCTVLAARGNLTLEDSVGAGKITGGNSDSGGGVYVGGGGSFTMTGGEISGNTASSNGGGVYVGGSMTVGGTAKITGNTKNSVANNVYLTNGKTIAVSTTPLISGASIGVKAQTVPNSTTHVNITGANDSDISSYFVSDNNAYVIQNSGSGAAQVVRLVASAPAVDVLISTADQLKAFAAKVSAGDDFDGKTVKLTSNIALTGEWKPIGQITAAGDINYFAGTFDGQGHTVSGMSITGDVADAGFFLATSGATIQNLTVSGSINVTGHGKAGGIIALVLTDTTITNCHSKVRITANVTSNFVAAGIAASVGDNVKIDRCSNSGAINAKIADAQGSELVVGGIVGNMFVLGSGSSIKNCANTGSLTAITTDSKANMVYLGGVAGNMLVSDSGPSVNAAVENCCNSGELIFDSSGSVGVGGIAGVNYGYYWSITNCYNVGTVSSSAKGNNYVGGIASYNFYGSVFNSYWKAGTADTCVQSIADTKIYNCGTFDAAGVLAATTDANAGTKNAEHGLPYGDTLLAALNGWVADQTTSADYQMWTVKSSVNGDYPIFGVESVANPTFSPVGGAYTAAQSVTISCATPDADIYYTTDGSAPTTDSTKYTASVSVSSTTTLKAIAVKSGLADSAVSTAAYTIQTGGGSHIGGGSNTTPADNRPEAVVAVPVQAPFSSDGKGNATVTVTQDKLNEILKAALQIAAQQGAQENGIVAELTVNTPVDTKRLTINLPKVVQDALVKEHVVELKINSSVIEISFDKAAIGAIQSTAGMDAQMTAKPAAALSTEAMAAIGSRPVFDLTLTYGGKTMSSFGTGKVYVGIPYTLGENEQAGNITVVYVDEGGKVTWLTQSSYDATRKLAIFTTDHFSAYGVAYKSDTPMFSDIDSHWAKEDILFVVNRGLFIGTGNGKFSPDLPITRGMFVTALGRLAQADVSGYKQSSFLDVPADAYYMGYVEWANKSSIVNGIGGGKYAPDAFITREQMAVMIDRYAMAIGFQLPAIHTENTFADGAKIGSWAKDAIRRVQMAGIINGKTGNLFDPQGNATRAEVSAVLKRFIEDASGTPAAQTSANIDGARFTKSASPATCRLWRTGAGGKSARRHCGMGL